MSLACCRRDDFLRATLFRTGLALGNVTGGGSVPPRSCAVWDASRSVDVDVEALLSPVSIVGGTVAETVSLFLGGRPRFLGGLLLASAFGFGGLPLFLGSAGVESIVGSINWESVNRGKIVANFERQRTYFSYHVLFFNAALPFASSGFRKQKVRRAIFRVCFTPFLRWSFQVCASRALLGFVSCVHQAGL